MSRNSILLITLSAFITLGVTTGCQKADSDTATKNALLGQGPPMTDAEKAAMKAGMEHTEAIRTGKARPPVIPAPVPGKGEFKQTTTTF